MDLINLLNNELNKILGAPPDIAHHYTGAEGLIGLIKNKQIWATKVSYLNDPVEERYGREIISLVAMEEAEKEKNKGISKFLSNISRNMDGSIMDCATDYYLASFSKNPDDLTQWKTYGHDGLGYSVGIKVGENGINNEHIIPVIYKKKEQLEFSRKFISLAIKYVKENSSTINSLNSAYIDLIPALKILVICMKQEAYSHEQEWRIVFSPDKAGIRDNLKFREGRHQTIIPYMPIALLGSNYNPEKIPIKRIVLGPQRIDEKESIELLLKKYDYPRDIVIDNSTIKYRS